MSWSCPAAPFAFHSIVGSSTSPFDRRQTGGGQLVFSSVFASPLALTQPLTAATLSILIA